MNFRIFLIPVLAIVLVDNTTSLHAQVADGTGALYTNATNAFNNVTIGTNGAFTLLILANNALFTNSGNGTIGLNASARSNEVRLVSPTARWFLGNFLYVGSNGSFNRLLVSNGATVRSINGYLGPSLGANSNLTVITGAGSVWSNNNGFYLGFNGAGNQLIVSNGGVLRDAFGTAGVNSSSSNNLAMVTGAGSLWSNAAALQFGYGGSGNQLVISNGGVVRSSLGLFGGGTSASNTIVTVTGAGSLWTNTTDFYVGQSSVGNQLLVSDGGVVRNGHGYVGANFTGSNNLALITGAGSVWSNALDLNVGAYSSFNQAIASNGATIFVARDALIGPIANGNANAVKVVGPGSRWLVATNLYVGSNGALSRLQIFGGGLVANGQGTVGFSVTSSNNAVEVTGLGSIWSNAYTLYLGYSGRSNQLLISEGGLVQDTLSYVGYDASSSNNLAVVTGPGSTWSNAFELYLGLSGAGNQLVISNGAKALSTIVNVGFAATSSSNVALITASGSIWSNLYEFYLGFGSAGNRLEISDGARLRNSIGNIGYANSSSNNLALVAGNGSVWSNSESLFVGNSGARNQLVVSNGAAVYSGGYAYLGYNVGASNNSAIVTDAGTRWLVASNLYVGSNGAMSQLTISNGALVVNGSGTIGQNLSSSNNVAVVVGSGSVWSNAADMFIGFNGRGNQLMVANGATVVAAHEGSIGYNSGAISNTVIVTDPGATWRIGANFAIGASGTYNRLIITNGGQVLGTANGIVGFNGGRSNLVVVTGPGSFWSNAASLFVGYSGLGNRLVVSNGAVARNSSGFVGLASANNLAIVTGLGSIWESTGQLSIGHFSETNQLVVSNGGWVRSGFGALGVEILSTNNFAMVTGAGSLWTNADNLWIGQQGSGNRIVVSNGGVLLVSRSCFLGETSTSTNNRIEINGGSLVVSNAASNGLLDIRRGTNVFVSGLMELDRLQATNILGACEFNGGTLRTGNTTHNNGRLFTVGNGANPAALHLRGGVHSFANNLLVTNNAILTGVGTVSGTVIVSPGGLLSPGSSIGKLTLNSSPMLQGNSVMEIARNGAALTNDEIEVATPLVYGGLLIVTNIGQTTLAAGDRFKLFTSALYAGSFSSITLPSLGINLSWTNKLSVDGSIEIIGGPVPKFTSFSRVGTNLVFVGTGGVSNSSFVVLTATNVSLPVSTWTSLATNQFGANGDFSFTNGLLLGEPQRYFRLRWP